MMPQYTLCGCVTGAILAVIVHVCACEYGWANKPCTSCTAWKAACKATIQLLLYAVLSQAVQSR